MRRTERAGQGSFALVSTLLIVAVMALGALAFFQAARMDRLATRNTADTLRAQLAAESGLAVAISQLQAVATNDTFIITLGPSNQLFAGHLRTQGRGAGTMNYWPLFSARPDPGSLVGLRIATLNQPGVTDIPMNSNSVTSPTVRFTNFVLPGGLAVTSPTLYWMAITNTNGGTNARFAFWVEDLGGRLDLGVVGSTNNAVGRGQVAPTRRPTGTNPAEIALWSLFPPTSASYVANAAADLISARSALLTPASARLVSGAVTPDLLADLAAGIVPDINQVELIPYGFGYADEGQPKYNLNSFLTASSFTNLARIIQSNLTNFTQRAGGFTNSACGGATNTNAYTGTAYLQTLAASIIDYADADSDPTTDGTALSTNRVRPVYRGVDSYPFISEVSKRWRLTTNEIMTVGGVQGRGIVIETTDFVELWNPSSQTASGSVTFVSVHRQPGRYGFLDLNFASPVWASNATGPVSNGVSTNVFAGLSIPPNGFVVQRGSTVTNFFFSPTTNSNSVILQGGADLWRYHVAWNGIFYDATLGGLFLNPYNANWSALPPNNNPTNRCNLPGFIYRTPSGGFDDPAVGDPRATLFLSRPVDAHQFTEGTSWWGRNRRADIGAANSYAEVSPRTWPDGGHDSPAGIVSTSQASNPDQLGPGTYSNIPPVRISNAGFYSNIFELGNIFDPIQYQEPSLGGFRGKYTNLSTAGVADNGYGGGNTLRIGRAEHPMFTNDGLRAAQLLDLFAVGPSGGGGRGAVYNVTNRIPSRINLNTATTNALRALAAGVVHTSDASLSPDGNEYTVPVGAVSNFIAGVTNFRSSQPFLSPSQLPMITSGTATYPSNAVFGNTNSNVLAVTAWNDAAAEEWFSKIYPFATVRSRNFLVHVVGQAMTTNTNLASRPLASSRKLFQIYASPVRDTNGLTTNVVFQVIQSWSL